VNKSASSEKKDAPQEHQTAINILKQGYCLWIGAGVTRHLASTGGILPPDWQGLVETFEEEVGIDSSALDASYAERLEIVLHQMGRTQFQRKLREEVLNKLSKSIIQAAKEKNTEEDIIPEQVRQLGQLGMLANPIVNFNIETLTSTAVAATAGAYDIKCFNPPLQESTTSQIGQGQGKQEEFKRCVYHPHGAINIYGLSVMTESQYGSLQGTLALELAVHSAFSSHLAIVGMSLEDHYLRQQLSKFRRQIMTVLWFCTNEPEADILKWAILNDITIVPIQSWQYFWNDIVGELPIPQKAAQCSTWMSTVERAFDTRDARGHYAAYIEMQREMGATEQELATLYQKATNCGERIELGKPTRTTKETKDIIVPILKKCTQLEMEE